MSMAFALEYAQEYMRNKNGWKNNECGVQFEATPPWEAGQHYIGIDDGGVEGGSGTTASLKEVPTLIVGVWRRPEHLYQKDRRPNLALPIDKYLLGAYTLYDLERMVIVCNPSQKLYGLHHNWEFMNGLNTRYGLPSASKGGTFCLHLTYMGRGRMERLGVEAPGGSSADPQLWYGYRLRFRGLLREQPTNNSAYALG